MLYLLDANVLIDANRDYYPMSRVPEFWAWLEYQAGQQAIAVVPEIYDELTVGDDDLTAWASKDEVRQALMLDEDPDYDLVSRVMDEGYANDLTDDEVDRLGRDPFLVAHALIEINQRVVVTTEVSKPSKKRANRHVPDVCSSFDVRWINTFQLIQELDFHTAWKSP